MSDKTLDWCWLSAYPKVEVGQTLTSERSLEADVSISSRALDALRDAKGTIICQLGLSGEVLAMADATKTLHEFACWCAEQALLREREAGREPDKRSWAAIETKRKWLKGKVTDGELDAASVAADAAANATGRTAGRAACAATSDAAWAAAWAASRSPTKGATWDNATVASSAAARAAAWVAASDAVWAASWYKIRATQNAKLEEMLNDLLKEVEGK
jgi:hypothetical protein